MATTKETQEDPRRKALRQIAEETLETIKAGSYLNCDLIAAVTTSKQNTRFYAPDSLFSTWASSKSDANSSKATQISLLEVSTLEGARLIANSHASSDSCPRIGVLNFASAKKPGGGFLSGAQAQEESIARSSTLYPTLMTRVAQSFYTLHNKDPKNGYYSHAMIYSPGVIVLRDDQGGWVEPLKIDVLTCAAVNAGVVRQGISIIAKVEKEKKIRKTMKERMARILFLFEQQGIKNIVLGSFGTGVFRNDVDIVAKLWGELLLVDKARFKGSFEHIVFAVLGRDTFETFEQIFAQY